MRLPPKVFLSNIEITNIFNSIDDKFIDINPIKYSEELFKGYKRVFIVGPQRSGTTFTSKAIASTLGFEFIDEEDFGVVNFEKFKSLFEIENIVVQAPDMTSRIHTLAGKDDLVVFMSRKWSEIVKSIYKKNGRVSNWLYMKTMFEYEKNRISKIDTKAEHIFEKVVDKDSYYLNSFYSMWKEYQSKIIPNCFALEYESMKTHPMWKDKDKRKHFHFKQTS